VILLLKNTLIGVESCTSNAVKKLNVYDWERMKKTIGKQSTFPVFGRSTHYMGGIIGAVWVGSDLRLLILLLAANRKAVTAPVACFHCETRLKVRWETSLLKVTARFYPGNFLRTCETYI
jgi:hypothetical protein